MREIAQILNVARSSVSRWVRDIELSAEQYSILEARDGRYLARRRGNEVMVARCRARRQTWQQDGREAARPGRPLHVAGCMLHWAEGDKNRNTLALTNSDPEVLRIFTRFLRETFAVPDEKVRAWCNLFADHAERQHEVEQFWLNLLDLPRSCLTKSTVNRYSSHSKRKRTNMLSYGTCRVTVHSTAIVQHVYGAIQEYGGFDRPAWLE